MADPAGAPTGQSARMSLRTGVVLDLVAAALAAHFPDRRADILDLGGGTGGLAVQLARQGHRVTVIDPSPDSLAALARRAAETGTASLVRGVQGDAAAVASLVPAGSVDLVLCHSVLEVVDDPLAAVRSAVSVLGEHGLVSLLVANRVAAVLARVGSGRLSEALRLITDGAGRDGDHDALARRFTVAELQQLIAAAALVSSGITGIRIFADAAPATLLDDAAAGAQLLALERNASRDPSYLGLATQLHALCERAPDPATVL